MTAEGLDGLLAAAAVDSAVHQLRPDYVALLLAASAGSARPSSPHTACWPLPTPEPREP